MVERLQEVFASATPMKASNSAPPGLARLWRDQGKVSEARELLAPVYGWLTRAI
jgi:hypothetical protein